MATVRRMGHPSPVWRGTIAMLIMTPSTTGCQYGPQAAGPFGQRDARRRPDLPQPTWGTAGFLWPACSPPRGARTIKETRRGKATVRVCKAAAL